MAGIGASVSGGGGGVQEAQANRQDCLFNSNNFFFNCFHQQGKAL